MMVVPILNSDYLLFLSIVFCPAYQSKDLVKRNSLLLVLSDSACHTREKNRHEMPGYKMSECH